MGKCRYLAIDYETEFARKRRNLLERLTVKYIAQPLDAKVSTSKNFSYREPWTGGRKECVILNGDCIGNDIEKLVRQCQQENSETERILTKSRDNSCQFISEEFTELLPQDVSKDFTRCLEVEELLSSSDIRKWRPCTKRLLQKHNAMVLSDPYEDIKMGYDCMERLNISEIKSRVDAINNGSKFAALEELDSYRDIFRDISALEVDESFFDERKLPKLTKEKYQEMPEEKLSLEGIRPIDEEVNRLAKSQSKGITALEILGNQQTRNDGNLECLDFLKEENEIGIGLEEPEIYPLAKLETGLVQNETILSDLKKFDVPDSLRNDLKKLVKDKEVASLEHEDCRPAQVSKLLLSVAKIDQTALRKVPGEAHVTANMLCQEQRALPTGNSELALNWSITKHAGTVIAKLQKPEKLACNKRKSTLTKDAKSDCVFCVEGEEFDKLQPESVKIPPQMEKSLTPILQDTVFDNADVPKQSCDLSNPEQKNAAESLNEVTPTMQDVTLPLSSNVTRQKDAKSNMKIHPRTTNVSSFDTFLQLRGLSTKPQEKIIQNTIPKINPMGKCIAMSCTVIKEIPKPSSTPKNKILVESKPADSNYKAVKVHITGGLLTMVLDLDKFIDPVFGELKKTRTVPRDSDPRSFDEERSIYLIKEVKKYVQLSGTDITEHPTYLFLVIFHCFILCKTRLLNLSAKSALGFLAEFYKENKRMLTSLIQFNDPEKLNSILFLMPLAIHSLKQSLTNPDFRHPKIHNLTRVVSERFSKDLKKGIQHTKILVLCTTYCKYLFEELEGILNNLKFGECEKKAVKTVGLALPAHPRFHDDVLSEAFKRDYNIIILSTNFLSPTFPWRSFSLLIEYEGRPDSPWKEITSANGIKHIALEMEKSNGPMHLSDDVSIKVESEDSIALAASTTISECGNLLHLLEARYNITIVERQFGDSHGSRSHFSEENASALSPPKGWPDLIIDNATCVIVETFASLNGVDGANAVNKILFRLLGLQEKFSKTYIIISDLSPRNTSYPLKGDFPLNLAKVHTFVNHLLKKSSAFEMTLFCSFDLEHFAYLINQLVERSRSKATESPNTRVKLSASVSSHENFLTQFTSINSLVAQEMLSVADLREICSKTLTELKETFPNIQQQFLEDFHNELHADATLGLDLPEEAGCSNVDVTPDFSFHLGDEFETSEDSSDFASRFEQNLKNNKSQIASDSSSSSFNIFSTGNFNTREETRPFPTSNPCRKRLRFERMKGWKGGQTRLTLS